MIHFCTNYSSSQVYESDHPCSRNISTRSSDSKVCCIYWTHGLTGLVAFRQHLQNLARTKGFLELNKAQIVLGDGGGGGGGNPTISPQDYPFSHQVRQQFVLFSVCFTFLNISILPLNLSGRILKSFLSSFFIVWLERWQFSVIYADIKHIL